MREERTLITNGISMRNANKKGTTALISAIGTIIIATTIMLVRGENQ